MAAYKLLSAGAILSCPYSHSPIVGASQENRVFVLIPVGVAPYFVNGPSVAIEAVHRLFRVRRLILQNRAVFSGCEVVDALAIAREIDRETSCVDEAHGSGFLLNVSSSIDIFMRRVGLSLKLE